MSSGLYPDTIIVERFTSSVSAATIGQAFIAPTDLDILGMLLYVGTAPGASDGLTVNITDNPVSQLGMSGSPSPYSLWTSANVPTILGSSKMSYTAGEIETLVDNVPYALNYPFPGPAGTVGYTTAQSTSQVTSNPVVAPPTLDKFGLLTGLVVPDNTYTNVNGVTGTPASHVHAGDVLSFVVAAAGSGLGASANLEIVLYTQKR